MVLTAEMCFHIVLEARSPRSRCWQVWRLLRPLSLACRQPPSPCVLMWSLLSGQMSLVSLCALIPSFKDVSQIALEPPWWPQFSLITSPKALSPYSHILRHWGLGFSIAICGAQSLAPKSAPLTFRSAWDIVVEHAFPFSFLTSSKLLLCESTVRTQIKCEPGCRGSQRYSRIFQPLPNPSRNWGPKNLPPWDAQIEKKIGSPPVF